MMSPFLLPQRFVGNRTPTPNRALICAITIHIAAPFLALETVQKGAALLPPCTARPASSPALYKVSPIVEHSPPNPRLIFLFSIAYYGAAIAASFSESRDRRRS